MTLLTFYLSLCSVVLNLARFIRVKYAVLEFVVEHICRERRELIYVFVKKLPIDLTSPWLNETHTHTLTHPYTYTQSSVRRCQHLRSGLIRFMTVTAEKSWLYYTVLYLSLIHI